MKLRSNTLLGFLLILFGLTVWFGQNLHLGPTGQVSASSPVTQTVPQVPASNLLQGKPTRIVIPSLDIDLPIIDGYYNTHTKQWTLSLDKVQYATITPYANNQAGNTFLYGHYRRGVFANLHKLKVGEQAIVYTDNNHVFIYTLKNVRETSPTDDSLFHYQGPPILTVQTCSGLWYQNRQLFTFDLTGSR